MPPTPDPLLNCLEDFVRSSVCDNRLLAMALAEGTSPTVAEVLQLAAEARAVYMMATLLGQSRLPGEVRLHEALWKQVHGFYQAACEIWADVPQDGELLTVYRHELAALQSVADDRCGLYSIDDSDRRVGRY
jgi:hypothetical protein